MGGKATDEEIMDTEKAVLRLINQKNYKKMHAYTTQKWVTILKLRDSTREAICIPKKYRAKLDCLMSYFFEKGRRKNIKNDVMSKALKMI